MTVISEIHELEQELHEHLITLLRTFPALEVTKNQRTGRDVGFPSDPGFKLSLLVGEKGAKPWQLTLQRNFSSSGADAPGRAAEFLRGTLDDQRRVREELVTAAKFMPG